MCRSINPQPTTDCAKRSALTITGNTNSSDHLVSRSDYVSKFILEYNSDPPNLDPNKPPSDPNQADPNKETQRMCAVCRNPAMHNFYGAISCDACRVFFRRTESWSLISGPCITTLQPPARHNHTAIIHGNFMYIYGGMNNLDAKSDFWRFNFVNKTWTKCNRGPGELHGHSAIKAFNCMFMFGGERNGSLLQELWRYNFDTEQWSKISTIGMLPSPRSRHTAIANPFIDLPQNNVWDQQTDASSSVSSNNSNQSETNRVAQFNYELTESNCRKNEKSKSTKKLDEDAQFKNEKNKENKCDCNRTNEGSIRKFFRKKMKNKLVCSMSTNSYNISHHENCNLNRTETESTAMKKSNTCYQETIKANQQTDNCLINSNTIDSLSTDLQDCTSISNSSQIQETNKTDKNKLVNDEMNGISTTNHNNQNYTEFRKYDIGQLSSFNSPDDESEEREFFKHNQLQTTNFDNLNNSNTQKPRPKSELIPESGNLDEEETFCWDGLNLKRSADELKVYYSLTYSSPQNLSNKLNSIKDNKLLTNTFNPLSNPLVKMRNRITNETNQKTRPKTYHPHLVGYNENDMISSYFESNLHGIKELESLNDDQLITEEEMKFDGKESPTKSECNQLEIELNAINETDNKFNADDKSDKTSPIKNDNEINNRINNNSDRTLNNPIGATIVSNTTTVCSPMSTSSVMDNSISQSLSLSSGYQSFMDDSLIDNSISNSQSISRADNSILCTNTSSNLMNSNQQSNQNSIQSSINNQNDKIRLRNQPNQLKLAKNQRDNRYSCNLSSFGCNYERRDNNDFINQIIQTKTIDSQQIDESNKLSNNNFNQTKVKQLPNSTSNMEISLNGNKATWERKMVKTFSTNAFDKDTIFAVKNVQRNHSNSFLNLSEKMHIGSLDFLIKKRRDKKKKKEYQFCMLVFGGNEKLQTGPFNKHPISVYKLYI